MSIRKVGVVAIALCIVLSVCVGAVAGSPRSTVGDDTAVGGDAQSSGTASDSGTCDPPGLIRFHVSGGIYQSGQVTSAPCDVAAGDTVEVTGEVYVNRSSGSDNIVFGVLGFDNGTVLETTEMAGYGSGEITMSTTVPEARNNTHLVWLFVPHYTASGAEDGFERHMDGWTPDNDGDGIYLGTVSETGPAPVVGESAPTDPDGDGYFEDVDGDGEQGTDDVLAYYDNRENGTVPDNPQWFDFDGDAHSGTVGDALALLEAIRDR